MNEAMRQTQISLIKTADMSVPVFWAFFILVGDWRQLLHCPAHLVAIEKT
jgi:hypothetical protein